jgi:hypothetical protein
MAKLPKQVQAQALAAEEFDNQVRAGNTPPTPEIPEPQEPPQPAAATPPASEPRPPQDEAVVWKNRFQTLQGKYNAEVPQLHAQVRTLTESVQALTKKLEEQPAKSTDKSTKLVTKEDVDAFGEDLVDMARRVAREEFGDREEAYQQKIAELKQELQQARGEVGQVVEDNAQQARVRFFKDLDAAVPKWSEVQQTQECQEWLASRMPGSRATWDQALKAAANDLDVETVAEIFGSFYEKHPALNPKKPAAKPAAAAQKELQRQVTPSRAASTPTQTAQKRTLSAREYEQESMRQMRLMQSGKWQEAQALEAELNLALAEGRVTV